MKTCPDILTIGDVVTDAFIELLPAEAEIEKDEHKHPLLCMSYGTKIPFKEEITVPGVGNAANAAVACARLGLQSSFMSDIGDDKVGQDILTALHKVGVSTEFVRAHSNMKSNYHYVLWYEADRTILIKHEAYDYQWPEIRQYQKPCWIYLSSIAQNGGIIHDALADYLEQNSDVELAFQPGTFQIREGSKKLQRLYEKTSIFAANKEEFQQILGTEETNENKLIAKMHALGPKIVLLTDGPKGAFGSDGKEIIFLTPFPDPKPPFDRTGAGDAYASTFTAVISEGKSIAEAMSWAGVNSCSVVQKLGAQAGLLTAAEIKQWLKKAPASYKPKSIK